MKKIVPQRLKPRSRSGSSGTAKAVPFLQALFGTCKGRARGSFQNAEPQRTNWTFMTFSRPNGTGFGSNAISGCFVADVGLDGVLNQLAPTLERQLVLDMRLVCFNCFYAEVQLLSNLAGAAAFADQAEYLKLTIG